MNAVQELLPAILLASRDAAILALVVGAVLLLFLRRLPPVWQHGLWMLVVVRLLLPALPESAFSWRHWLAPAEEETVYEGTIVFPEGADRFGPRIIPEFLVERTVTLEPSPEDIRHFQQQWTLWEILPPLWATGTLAMLTMMAFGWMRFQRRIARYERRRHPRKQDLDAMLATLCSEQGIARAPGLVVTDAVDGPALTGWWRPRILLPGSAVEGLSDAQWRMVMLHELGHLRRRDVMVSWLLGVLQAVHWFNPVIWWAFRRIRVEAERATDEWVLRRRGTSSPVDYGETLIRLLESPPCGRYAVPGLVGVLESRFSLRSRLVAIRRYRGASRPWVVAVAVLVLLGMGVAGLTQPPVGKKKAADSTAPMEKPEPTAASLDLGNASQVQLAVKVWREHADRPDELIASPIAVSLLDEWTLFEERSKIRYPTAYGLPSLPEDLAAKASGGGGEEGKPGAKWETNRNAVVLPPHPSGFETKSPGWTLKMRPERTQDGKVRVACVVEQEALRGFVNRGVPITVMQPAGVLKKEKPRIATENRQLYPVFLERRRELIFEPEGGKLVAKVVSDTGDPVPGGESLVEGFADRFRSPELPKLRIEVEATPVAVATRPAEVAAKEMRRVVKGGAKWKEKVQIYVTARVLGLESGEGKAFEGKAFFVEGVAEAPPFLTDPQFQVIIRALDRKKGVDILSAPSVMLRDGNSEEIGVMREFIYPVSYDPPTLYPATAASPATPKDFEKANIGLKLQVKASLRPKEMIELELSPIFEEFHEFLDFGAPIHHVENGKLTDITISGNEILTPVFDISSQRMKVQVPDGHTVCFGGFVLERKMRVDDKLPVLGLIADSKKVVERTSVRVFVTARMIDTGN